MADRAVSDAAKLREGTMQYGWCRILVVDDDKAWCRTLREQLAVDFGIKEVDELGSFDCDVIARRLDVFDPDLLLLDFHSRRSGRGSLGVDVSEQLRRRGRGIPIVLISEDGGTEERVAQGLERGAHGYISKTVCGRLRRYQIQTCLERLVPPRRVGAPDQGRTEYTHPAHAEFLTASLPVKQALAGIRRRFDMGVNPVLLVGENGSGKEAVLREALRGQRIVTVNSATIQDALAESLLFGHVKGAFTGAQCSKKGFFEEARGKVLFLDEVADMTLAVQTKLLRAIEDGEIVPLGATKPVDVSNLRIVMATHEDLEQRVTEGRFREDLLHRIKWDLRVENPPLRRRPKDIEVLARDRIERLNGKHARHLAVDAAGWEEILSFHWPGNVRQLLTFVEGLFLGTDDGVTHHEVSARLRSTYGYHSSGRVHTPEPPDAVFAAPEELRAIELFRSKRFVLKDVADAVRADPSLWSNPYLDCWRNNLSLKLRRVFLTVLVACELDPDAATRALLSHLVQDAQLAHRVREKVVSFIAQQDYAFRRDPEHARKALLGVAGKRLAEPVRRFCALLGKGLGGSATQASNIARPGSSVVRARPVAAVTARASPPLRRADRVGRHTRARTRLRA